MRTPLARVPAITRFARPSGQPSAVTPVGRCLVYQTQLSIRGQGASMPLPARLESSKRCYWLCQTSGWNEWADKTVAAMPACFFGGALRAQNQKTKKPKNQKTKKPKNQKTKKPKNQKTKKKQKKKISGRRPPKKIQVATVFPGPFVPARR